MKKFFGMLLLGVILLPQQAYAHSVRQDTTDQHGILMHSTPDDRPLALRTSDIYFDIAKQSLSTDDYNFDLLVIDPDGEQTGASLHVLGEDSLLAQHVFERTGEHTMILSATPTYISGIGGEPVRFEFSQYVASVFDDPSSRVRTDYILGGFSMILGVLLFWSLRSKQAN